MKYCYQCGRVTTGEPLYCNSCGRSYNTKLCPRGHANPRSAEVCSQCGSRDLSTPQPRVPLRIRLLAVLLSLVPGFLLVTVSLLAAFVLIRALFANPQWLLALVFLGIACGILAWIWSELPLWFRNLVRRLLKSKRKDDRS
jgi:RNA polymerase subunit RPABC4/transcription elongation factor Spt4